MIQRESSIITLTTELTTEIIETTTDKIIIMTMEYVYYVGKDQTMPNSEQMPKIFLPKILLLHDGTTNSEIFKHSGHSS